MAINFAAPCFRNARFTFATNHAKADAALESFATILNSQIIEMSIDSDALGTFSGEVERPGTMLDALRLKVKLALQQSSERFLLVSEGSFGPASGIGFLPQDHELLMVYDTATNVEILESYISLKTNFASQAVSNLKELDLFMERIGFGAHGLILYADKDPKGQNIFKGITQSEKARSAFELCLATSTSGIVTALADMRACFNPTRMECLKQCAIKLAHRLNTTCPTCKSGGFGAVDSIPGLPCGNCQLPTRLTLKEKYLCPFCSEVSFVPRTDGITSADPSSCEWCNP